MEEALRVLNEILNASSLDKNLRFIGRALQKEIIKERDRKTKSAAELARIAEAVTAGLSHPNDMRQSIRLQKMAEKIKTHHRASALWRWLLILSGVLLILSSIALAVCSGGLLSPFSIAGTAAGIALISTASASGATALTSGAMLFYKQRQNKQVVRETYRSYAQSITQ